MFSNASPIPFQFSAKMKTLANFSFPSSVSDARIRTGDSSSAPYTRRRPVQEKDLMKMQ